MFIFGLIVGLLISTIILLVHFILNQKINNSIKKTISLVKEKGEIFLPPSENSIKLEKNYDIV